MFEEFVLMVEGSASTLVDSTGLASLQLKERAHLQEWVLRNPQVLGEGVRVVTSEYDRWQSALGDAVRDRLDVLGLAPDGRLVVAELKLGEAPHTIHMQAINYAAMVSRLTTRDVAEIYAEYEQRRNVTVDVDAALADFESKYLLTDESIRNPRIVLIAEAFPPSVTASVVWLNERAADISLVRYQAYRLPTNHVIVTFSRFFPVPTAEDFTIGRSHPTESGETESPVPVPWDESALTKLAKWANAATQAFLDLCSSSDAPVTVRDVQSQAGLAHRQVVAQLAGLTMLLRNKKNGFAQSTWPFDVAWDPEGFAVYTMSSEMKQKWHAVQDAVEAAAARVDPPNDSAPGADGEPSLGGSPLA
jgi:hypothetical protein